MLSSAEIVFCSRIRVSLLQDWVRLPSALALFVIGFCIWILMAEMNLMPCSHSFINRSLAPKLIVWKVVFRRDED